jgi:allantoin racemase
MRILIINPNTSQDFTQTIDATAKKHAANTTEIVTVNPEDGPDYLDTPAAQAMQIPKVIDIIRKNEKKYDAFVIACGADPGLEESRQVTPRVLGISQAAVMTACAIAPKFSFLNVVEWQKTLAADRMRRYDVEPSRCVSARCVGSGIGNDIVVNRQNKRELWYEVGKQCIEQDGAAALILSCAGTSDLREFLEERLKVPIIAGAISAVKIAEQMPVVTK